MTDLSSWHWWFAWYPVKTDCGWEWLSTVLRRQVHNNLKGSQNSDSHFEYK